MTMNGGTFAFRHGSANAQYTETVGALSLNSGANTISTDVNSDSGGTKSSIFTFASLSRSVGATVNFGGGTGNPSAASDDNNVRFTSAPTLVNGIVGGYATVGSTGWATYSGGGNASVEALGPYITTVTNADVGSNYAADNIDVTSSQTPNTAITPNSLRFNDGTARTLTLQGTNTITSGGILVTATAANGGTISGGTLTGAAGTDLVVHQYSAGSLTINSAIANNTTATGLTKSGTGVLTLAGINTYTGITSINDGSLVVNGSTAGGAISVASIAKLFGSGTIEGATTILGTHSSGASGAVGTTQTFSSSLSYSSGSIFEWDIDVATNQSGETHDKLVANSLLGSGAQFKVQLASGDSFTTAFWNNTQNWTATDLFGIINASVNLSNIFSSVSSVGSSLEGTFSFTSISGGTNNQLTWTAVPEPTSALAGILLGAGLLRRKRVAA